MHQGYIQPVTPLPSPLGEQRGKTQESIQPLAAFTSPWRGRGGIIILTMKQYTFMLLLALCAGVSQGQTTLPNYSYEYDGAGNQTRRWRIVIMQKIQQADSALFAAQPIVEVNTTVYPNPTKGLLKVQVGGESPNGTSGRISVRVISLAGVALINREEVSRVFDIDLSTYPPGVYLVIIGANDQTTRLRVVKE